MNSYIELEAPRLFGRRLLGGISWEFQRPLALHASVHHTTNGRTGSFGIGKFWVFWGVFR